VFNFKSKETDSFLVVEDRLIEVFTQYSFVTTSQIIVFPFSKTSFISELDESHNIRPFSVFL